MELRIRSGGVHGHHPHGVELARTALEQILRPSRWTSPPGRRDSAGLHCVKPTWPSTTGPWGGASAPPHVRRRRDSLGTVWPRRRCCWAGWRGGSGTYTSTAGAAGGGPLYPLSGVGAAKDTIDPLLGQPPSPEFVARVGSWPSPTRRSSGSMTSLSTTTAPAAALSPSTPKCPPAGYPGPPRRGGRRRAAAGEEMGCLATIHMDLVVHDDGATREARERVSALVRLMTRASPSTTSAWSPAPPHQADL